MTTYSYDGLESFYREKAIAALGESPERLQAHIQSLRRWLQMSPHISNCPTDDNFILRFLRVVKFDQEKAQKRLENFCTIRGSKERGLPSRFEYPSLDNPELDAYLKMGVHIPLGYNRDGEVVILIRFSQWDTSIFSYDRLLTFTYMVMEVLFADERAQIAGVTAIIDLGATTKKQNVEMMNFRLFRECVRIWQEAFPFRNRQMIYYRESVVVDLAFDVLKYWLNPKLVARTHRIKNDLSKLPEKIAGAAEVLPTEYGGRNGSISSCREAWERKFRQFWTNPNLYSGIAVDEKNRPQTSLNLLQSYDEVKDVKVIERIEALDFI